MSKEKLLKTSKKTGELLLNTTFKFFFGKVWILGSKIKRNDGGLSFLHSTVWPVCSSWLSSGWDVPMPSCFFCCKIPHFPILWHCQFNLLSSKRNIALHSYNNRIFFVNKQTHTTSCILSSGSAHTGSLEWQQEKRSSIRTLLLPEIQVNL